MTPPSLGWRLRPPSIIYHIVVALGLLIVAGVRAFQPPMTQPFELDELLTVRYYTWLCVTDTGETRHVDHIDDVRGSPQPTLKNLLMGIYCTAGRWPEPNNHILNSALIDASLLWQRSERAARLPALLGSAVFAFAIYWLCGPILGWRFAAPLVAAWSGICPFLVEFGFRARGYTWMLALQVLFVLALIWSARKPTSLTRGALCAAIAIASFLNVVNMAIDWLLPVYVAMFFFAPDPHVGANERERAAWRTNLLLQGLVVGAVGATFLVGHLPSVYSSSQQYGLAFHSLSQLLSLIGAAVDFLFPGPAWKTFGLLSLVGLLLLLFSNRVPWLSALIVVVLATGVVHVLAAGKLPYERGLSYVLPVAILGAAYLAVRLVELPSGLASRVAVGGICVVLSAFLVVPALRLHLSGDRLDYSLDLARQLTPASGLPTFIMGDRERDYPTIMYRPHEWQYVARPPVGTRMQIVSFLATDGTSPLRIPVQQGADDVSMWQADRWQHRAYPASGFMNMLQIVGETKPFPDASVPDGRALIFWYPDVTRLGIRGDDQIRLAADSGLRYLARSTRYAAKLDIYTNLECIVFVAESLDEYQRASSTVSEALARLGGSALVFEPQ